jgi:hypothetical protein
VIQISDRVPKLRIIVEHMLFDRPREAADRPTAVKALQETGKQNQIFSKVLSILRNCLRVNGASKFKRECRVL